MDCFDLVARSGKTRPILTLSLDPIDPIDPLDQIDL